MPNHNQKLGKEGEEFAATYLKDKGWTILERNLQLGHDEIDILAKTDGLLVVVEVKTRATDSFGVPQDFITPQKEHSLIRACERYLLESDWEGETRFDLLAVYYAGRKPKLIHIEDAFYPSA